MVKKVLAMLLRPPLPRLAGLVLLTVVILVGGRELRNVLRWSDTTLYALCAGVWLLAGVFAVWRRLQARKRSQLIEDRLRGQAREHRETLRPDRRGDVDELEKGLNEAIGALKTSKLGKSALYALPWYIVIGPPGSGKTTLLRESGLSFPQTTHGRGIRGVGGTRNCDWWFTDAGILLDTAGRYTTQIEDREEWIAFLDMLKKARARKPINGALIAISLADVLQASEDELADHARRIRERLSELTERLELVFPVYLLFTKCDLLDGFVEMFGAYSKKERAQVWGFTLPYLGKDPEPLSERFGREFDVLYERLCAERLHNLGGATSQAKKRKIFSFPLQFALTRDRLRSFVDQLVQPNPYHESSDVRGIYLTSGTQEGKPLDQILRTMRLASGLQTAAETPADADGDKKAYFIDDLFTEVVFRDQDLARSSAKAERRRRQLQRGGLIATGVATFALTVALFVAFASHANLIARSRQIHDDVQGFTRDRANARSQDLERLRELFVQLDEEHGTLGTWLIGQTNQLYERRIRPLYIDKLRTTFLDPCTAYLEAKLEEAIKRGKPGEDEIKLISDRLSIFSMLQGLRVLEGKRLEELLSRDKLWTWGEIGRDEVPACYRHLDTFINHVTRAGATDWRVPERRSVVEKAQELIDAKDLYWLRAKEVFQEKLQNDVQKLDQVLAEASARKQLNPRLEIPDWAMPETVAEADLAARGASEGQAGGEKTVEVVFLRARERWLQVLADGCKREIFSLNETLEWLLAATGEESAVVPLYVKSLNALERFGVKLENRETEWLRDCLATLRTELEPELKAMVGLDLNEVVRTEAKDGGAFERLKNQIGRARNSIDIATKAAPLAVRDTIRTALGNLVGNVQFAIRYQVFVAAGENWRRPDGLHTELARFERRAPFATDPKAEAVTVQEFTDVFAAGGKFDKTRQWITWLRDNDWGRFTDSFADSCELAEAIRKTCFGNGRAEISCELLVQNRANVSNTVLQLGTNRLETKTGPLRRKITWPLADGARLGVEAKVMGNDEALWLDDYKDRPWGLLLLLHDAVEKSADKPERLDREVFSYTFQFKKREDVIDRKFAEAVLLFFKDTARGPLDPSFFRHTFSLEVFVEPKR